jgi:hypothetical protein
MPKGPRLDAPATLHHVMVRGIERRRIFKSEWRVGLTGRQLSDALQMSPGGIHSASVRGEAFVRENGDLEKSLISYLNN